MQYISAILSRPDPSFYVTGGTLHLDAPSYVERRADSDLYDGLVQGDFCYVLTSRQMGKSSLMVRAVRRLRQEPVSVAVLDLTAVGQNVTVEQWYDGLLVHLGTQLNLENELETFWNENQRVGPLQRWSSALEKVVLDRIPGRVVIFVDEIDIVRSLPFSTDEFFAAIRECYNRRSRNQKYHRLSFCLLGVAAPSDLIQDSRVTPFNIGRRIELNDFTETEAAALARGLGREEPLASKLVSRALHWTGGHPYLTQRLCRAIALDPMATGPADVDGTCDDLFLSTQARERDDNLQGVRLELLAFAGPGKVDYSSGTPRPLSPVGDEKLREFGGVTSGNGIFHSGKNQLAFRRTGMTSEHEFVLQATDDRGRRLAQNGGSGGSNDLLFRTFDVPADAQTVDLTVIVHTGRTAEFTVRPPLPQKGAPVR